MRIIRRTLLVLLVVVILLGTLIYFFLRAQGLFRDPVYDQDAPQNVSVESPAILVFDKTNGFIHKDAIPAANDLLARLAEANGWNIYHTDNAAIHNATDLRKFDVIVWNNVSGDVLTEAQRQAFESYLRSGGGYVGLHASGGDPEYAWSWYVNDVIKAQFKGHPMFPQKQSATLIVDAPEDPIVAHLPHTWVMADEWYSFDKSPRPGVEVLLSIDEASYSPKMVGVDISMGKDHPMMWKHCLGKGRAFYSALGHYAEIYSDANYSRVVEQAIAWASGKSGEPCKLSVAK